MKKQYIMSGKVQGASFRVSTQQVANSLNIQGWVANLHNGNVKVVAEANASILEKFEIYLREGPQYANVNKVHIETLDEDACLEYDGFQIKPDQDVEQAR